MLLSPCIASNTATMLNPPYRTKERSTTVQPLEATECNKRDRKLGRIGISQLKKVIVLLSRKLLWRGPTGKSLKNLHALSKM